MKKIMILLIFFLCLNVNNAQQVMSYNEKNNYYELDFKNETLNFNNFKLKLGLFSSYESNITKIYFKYNEKTKKYVDKKYISFDNDNFAYGIEKLKEEYIVLMRSNYLYDEIENINNVEISKVDIYTNIEVLNKFKTKYPNVIINKINK